MDKRTSARLAKLAGRVLETGKATPSEVRQLAACVLAQCASPPSNSERRRREVIEVVVKALERRGLLRL